MYLKAVEIYGFKSFGEKIYIEFNKGITSIVGPNGSGKSNIMDAVLWVLGEQSYKNIRAKDSSDVIFSGSGKNSNYAEVSLYIDNSDKYLEIESEIVKISRKVQKNGDNDYYINGTKSRLKDISSMFMDTGVGKSAYSVIGQGKVERIISSSNKEIKGIIEEAAGIKKFQIKKQDSLRNLKSLDDELEKVELVIKQVEDNKNHLEKQAVKAKEFLNIKNDKELLEKGVLTFDLDRKKSELEKIKENKERTEKEIFETENRILENDNNFEKNEIERNLLEKLVDENIEKNRELKDVIEIGEREKARISERIESFKRELEEKQDFNLRIQEKIESEKNQLIYFKEELTNIDEKISLSEDKNIKFSFEIENEERRKKEKELDQEIKKRKLMDLEVEKLKVVNEIENSSRRAKTSENKLQSLKIDMDNFSLKVQEFNKSILNYEKEKNDQELKAKQVSERVNFLEEKITNTSMLLNKVTEKNRDNEYEEKRASLKYQNILRLEESNEGLFRGVKEVLNNKIPGVHGIVASIINIPEGLEKAIEAAIPGNLQDIVVDNTTVAKKGIELLKQSKAGRASFLALDTIQTSVSKKEWKEKDGVIGLGSNLITSELKYKKIVEFLLGNLLIVKDMDSGLKILKSGEHVGNIVTVTGELLSSRGRITGGENQNSALTQILERKKEKIQLEQILKKCKFQSEEYHKEIQKYKENLQDYEEEIFKIDEVEENIKKILKNTKENLEDSKVKKERAERDLYVIKSEYQDELNYIEEFSKKINNYADGKENVEKQINIIKYEMEQSRISLVEIEEKLRIIKEKYSDIRIIYLNTINKKEQLENDMKKISINIMDIEQEIKNNDERIFEIQNQIELAYNKILQIELEINEKTTVYENENQEINKMKQKISKLSEEERALIDEKKKLESKIIKIRDQYLKQNEQVDKISFEMQRIIEMLENLNDVELIELRLEDYESSKQKYRVLENKLKNFETVNLLAIDEYEELLKKYNYLNEQYLDMDKSKKILIKIIDEISREIDNRFKHAHTEIDKNFNEMCNDILANSEGKLLLTEGDNLENSGIDIIVKFKNKKSQSLSLFSGGEKSMVAIAFIMAIFMYKPSPFTFLDEIEAALDDKNTRKLIGKLKEFTEKSQFILITHNKETMRESDSIFGVTMNKEIGISKIVPVKF